MKYSNYTVIHPIDFVVTWLDSSDKIWQKEYLKYKDCMPQEEIVKVYYDYQIKTVIPVISFYESTPLLVLADQDDRQCDALFN